MKKIEAIVSLKTKSIAENNETFKIIGEIKESTIKYKEKDGSKISLSFNKDSVKLIRENKEIKMFLKFKKDMEISGEYYIKDLCLNIPIKVFTDELLVKKDQISIKYYLTLDIENMGMFEYNIDYKEL